MIKRISAIFSLLMIIGLVPALLIPTLHAGADAKTAAPYIIPALRGKTQKFAYDPLHTQVFFTIDHLGFTTVRGRFNSFKGTFTIDTLHPERSRADFTIDANSVDLNSAIWDKHTEEDFLGTDKYPEISFKSTKIVQTGPKTARMTGDLTLHGVTQPVTLDVTLSKIATNTIQSPRVDAGFHVTGTIKRSDFGITKYLSLIGDDVGIDVWVDGFYQPFKLNK